MITPLNKTNHTIQGILKKDPIKNENIHTPIPVPDHILVAKEKEKETDLILVLKEKKTEKEEKNPKKNIFLNQNR